jgi:hypothetical protein
MILSVPPFKKIHSIIIIILEKKCLFTTVLTAVKKPTVTPGARRPGRLRSWSAPVQTDFQCLLRFSSGNRPRYPIQHGVGYDKTKKHTDELNGEERGKGRGGGERVKGSAS